MKRLLAGRPGRQRRGVLRRRLVPLPATLAIADGEGFYYVCDRLRDMVITGGENDAPALRWRGVLARKHPACPVRRDRRA
ncbi:hypothetical protein ACU4GD_24555 [Cupriavidus basilensis]